MSKKGISSDIWSLNMLGGNKWMHDNKPIAITLLSKLTITLHTFDWDSQDSIQEAKTNLDK